MVYFAVIVLIQLVCVVHVIRSGTNSLWVLGIILAPLLGSLAYFLLEVLPGMQGNRHVRYARKKAVSKIDPEREIRAAQDQIEITDSMANRARLADALAETGRYDEAIEHYEKILSGPHGRYDKLLFKYATALFENGRSVLALEVFEQIEPVTQTAQQDRRSLLHARILESMDRDAEADAIYAEIAPRLAGIEARSRYAALLIKMDRDDAAREQLEEVVHTTRQMDRTQIGDDRPILDWAKTTLRDLSD